MFRKMGLLCRGIIKSRNCKINLALINRMGPVVQGWALSTPLLRVDSGYLAQDLLRILGISVLGLLPSRARQGGSYRTSRRADYDRTFRALCAAAADGIRATDRSSKDRSVIS